MKNIAEILEGVKTMGIGGHIRPDGDCVGSCMALYLYVKTYYPEIQVDVYLDNPKPVFGHIDCMDEIKTELYGDKEYDLFVTCDVSARDRLALAGPYFDTAKKTACIDHHISNPGFAQVNHIRGEVSSACEVLYGLFDPEKVVRTIAVPIYTGMVHDTGVFQYSSTSPETMRIAGELMKTGFNFSKIIDESFLSENLRAESGYGTCSRREHYSSGWQMHYRISQEKRHGLLWSRGQGSGWHRQPAAPYRGRGSCHVPV